MTARDKLARGLQELRRANAEREEERRRARATLPHGDIRSAARSAGQYDRIYPDVTDGRE